MVDLNTRLGSVVGGASAKKLHESFAMSTVGDLLWHFPRTYVDFSKPDSLADLRPGEYSTFTARIVDATSRQSGRNRKLTIQKLSLTDGEHFVQAAFFNQPWLAKTAKVGSWQIFAGEIGWYEQNLQVLNPQMRDPGEGLALERGIVPVYPATRKVTSFDLEKAVSQVFLVLDDQLPDPLAAPELADRGFVPVREAFRRLHQPEVTGEWHLAKDRFRFEEALVLQTLFAQRRAGRAQQASVARPLVETGSRERFVASLPFALTQGQQDASTEIAADLAREQPMHRLLQGEVGSGKTVVAVLAMLQVVDGGAQAALLAPTEVLAQQHFRTIGAMLEGICTVRLLTGSMGAKATRESLLDAASGRADIVIGTHALLEDRVQFAELGLVVVDEQHRFGVEQRAALVEGRTHVPHQLVMTATPIPRTVAMTVFGDLETTTLAQLPAGRQPIQTTVVPAAERPGWLERAWQRVAEEVREGRQAYVVASRIGETATEDSTMSAIDLYELLSSGPLADVRVALLHGQLRTEVKDEVMTAFSAGDIDVLVATTVIEVGVDVPNATVMVIVDAERFGVSQLHQLRGRVGRGKQPGLCLLVTTSASAAARERLTAVAATNDGFEISRFDVEQRREGDVLGVRQSGVVSSLRLLSVVRDEAVIAQARDIATALVGEHAVSAELAAAVTDLQQRADTDYLEKS